MRNDNILNETLDDVLKSGYNLPKSRTNKVLSNMKNIFLGSILGTGLILGINYLNHKKIQKNFKKDVKYEVSFLVNESISNEDVKNYIYHKIDGYLEQNPDLISKTYKTSIDSLVNFFINELNDELKEYSKLRLNENLSEEHNYKNSEVKYVKKLNHKPTEIKVQNNKNYSDQENVEDLGPRVISNEKGNGFIVLRNPDGRVLSPGYDPSKRNNKKEEDLGPRVISNERGNGFIVLRNPDGTKVGSNYQNKDPDYKSKTANYDRQEIETKFQNKTINYYFFINKIENKTLIYNENLEHIRTIDGVEKISKEMFNNYIPINLEDIKKLK